MSARISTSTSLRLEGNKQYIKALECDFNMHVRKDCLMVAMKSFNRALAEAKNPDEFASASKNCATVNKEVAHTMDKLGASLDVTQVYYEFSVAHYSKAMKAGKGIKAPNWVEHLTNSYSACLHDFVDVIQHRKPKKRVESIEEMMQSMQDEPEDDVMKIICYKEIAKGMMIQAVELILSDDFKGALSVLADSYRPVEETRRLTKRCGGQDKDIEEMEQDFYHKKCIADSIQAIKIGDQLSAYVLTENEELNIDGVWEVLDWYKKAILLSKEFAVQ